MFKKIILYKSINSKYLQFICFIIIDGFGKLPKTPNKLKINKQFWRNLIKTFFYKLTTDKDHWSKYKQHINLF